MTQSCRSLPQCTPPPTFQERRFPGFRLALAFLVPAVLAAQVPQDRPTFRSGVEYVEVDVLVTDKKGNAVRDLTKDDFTILEDDQPQRIESFSFVELPVESASLRKEAVGDVEPDVVTNTAEGRLYVMLINVVNHRARLIARRFVEEAVGPNDQMAVIHTLGNMSAAQGFTPSRGRMLAAIDRIFLGPEAGSNGDLIETGFEPPGSHGDTIIASFEVLEDLVKRMGQMSGRRKVVLWFDPPSMFMFRGLPGESNRLFAQRDALRAATRNNVALYVVDTRGLTTGLGLGPLEYKAGLRVLADDTGGQIITETNNFTPEFQRFVRDNSSYYLLGYVPTTEYRDGKFHNLTVRVNRKDVTVRARRGYYAPEPDAEAEPAPEIAAGLSPKTAEALGMPSSSGELGIELFVAPFKGEGKDGSVVIGAQLRGSDLVLGGGEQIEVAYNAMTTEGEITPGAFHVLTLDFTPESRTSILRTGVGLVQRITLPRGRHQVRFAVHQPNGKTGSVVADVEIPDYTKQPLTMSGVVLASQRSASGRMLMGDDRLKALLGADSTPVRHFVRGDTLTAFAEVYTDGSRETSDVRVTGTLATARGRKVLERDGVPAGDPPDTGYVFRIPLTDLAPGDYVLTIEGRAGKRTTKRQLKVTVSQEL